MKNLEVFTHSLSFSSSKGTRTKQQQKNHPPTHPQQTNKTKNKQTDKQNPNWRSYRTTDDTRHHCTRSTPGRHERFLHPTFSSSPRQGPHPPACSSSSPSSSSSSAQNRANVSDVLTDDDDDTENTDNKQQMDKTLLTGAIGEDPGLGGGRGGHGGRCSRPSWVPEEAEGSQ